MSAEMEVAGTKVLTRDEIRSKISSSPGAKIKSKVINIFSTQVEMRQPTLGSIQASRGTNEDGEDTGDTRGAVVATLIDNAYVPGTDEKVFDDADVEWLKGLPFGRDIQLVTQTINELSDLDFLSSKKKDDSGKTT